MKARTRFRDRLFVAPQTDRWGGVKISAKTAAGGCMALRA